MINQPDIGSIVSEMMKLDRKVGAETLFIVTYKTEDEAEAGLAFEYNPNEVRPYKISAPVSVEVLQDKLDPTLQEGNEFYLPPTGLVKYLNQDALNAGGMLITTGENEETSIECQNPNHLVGYIRFFAEYFRMGE